MRTILHREGIYATTHGLRCRLQRVAETFQKEVAKGKQTVEFMELEKLLAKGRRRLMYCKKLEDSNMDTTNDQSFEPARESDAPDNDHIETNLGPSLPGTSSLQLPSQQKQLSLLQLVEDCPLLELVRSSPLQGQLQHRQKLELETTLERFLADQKERQQEQREHKRTRLSEQQDLQRQTIDLQKRALDIQEKAMNMQERLMALMEKVMDKLN
ncbi:hypothetical protein PC119_g22228 [Phytophthora cactorum]|uniref:Uncharacterized protein n=1 Tax=Phytophthora cactorum TaxID=29920 RepID=A0A8T0YZC9_9STRA|nr:hypothetical protein PC111_g19873 [Phytophthora cactorum]KAG2855116.1 hypothetical protein PC113_g12702 [Phytophthora cactorum]KAG2898507.1 hypothetical protein PC117_g22508 [Phytophthora cactorum]KAG2976309.1 hypothetical protein PC119_g22228 [Phytophthora cactorum]KAG3007255.1 hypothetical protein PC120_g16927 [Phytophthora cactorum]